MGRGAGAGMPHYKCFQVATPCTVPGLWEGFHRARPELLCFPQSQRVFCAEPALGGGSIYVADTAVEGETVLASSPTVLHLDCSSGSPTLGMPGRTWRQGSG